MTAGPRPRHAMVVHASYPVGGTMRVQRQAEALVAAGYDVDVICARDAGDAARERYRGVEVHRLDVAPRRRSLARQTANYLYFCLRAGVYLTRLHARRRYVSIQAHNLPDLLVFSALVPRLQGVPVILDLHDLMPEFLQGRTGRGPEDPLARLVRWQERVSCRFADHVLTVSDPWRETLISRGVPPDRCSVVMNVADRAVFSGAEIRARNAGDGFHLLYHGYITRRYGVDVALSAVARLRGEIPGLRFTVVGDGEHLEDMRRLSTELALDDIVAFLPARPPAELPELIASADLGVVASRDDVFTDSLVPTKLMEFAEMGVPCVASRTTAIEHYFAGTMVELCRPGDVDDLARAIVELWRDPARRAALASGGERFTSRYNWTEIGAEYVRLVATLGGVEVAAAARESVPA